MQQSSSYPGQSYTQPAPVVLDPSNRAYAEGRGSYPSGWLGNLFVSLLLLGFLVVGSFFMWQGLTSSLTANELAQSGVQVEARVVSPHSSTDNKGFKHYSLVYTFTAVGTASNSKSGVYQNESPVMPATYGSHPAGSKITVRYLRANPTVSDVPDGSDSTSQNPLLFVLAALFYVIGIVLAWFFVRKWRLERALKRHGQLLPGQLISSQIVRAVGASGRTSLRIEYRFLTPQGDPILGKQSFLYDSTYHDPLNLQLNTQLIVAYADPKHYQVL